MFKIITLIFSIFTLVGGSVYVSIQADAEKNSGIEAQKKYVEPGIRKVTNNNLSIIAKNKFDSLKIKSNDIKIFEQYVTN